MGIDAYFKFHIPVDADFPDDVVLQRDANELRTYTHPAILAETEKDVARLTAENKDLHEQVAALESKEVCTLPHDDEILEGCPYCSIERLIKDNEELEYANNFCGRSIESLTTEISEFQDLQLCDCCEGLFETVSHGDHNQCETCSENYRLTAEVQTLKLHRDDLLDENREMMNGINRIGGMALIKASHEHIRQACSDALPTSDSGRPEPQSKSQERRFAAQDAARDDSRQPSMIVCPHDETTIFRDGSQICDRCNEVVNADGSGEG